MFVTASRLHPGSARHQNKGLKEWIVMCPEYQFNLLLLIHMQILTSVKAYQLPHVLYLRDSEQWKRGEYNKPQMNCGDTKGGQLLGGQVFFIHA